jgi:hypothetical protein
MDGNDPRMCQAGDRTRLPSNARGGEGIELGPQHLCRDGSVEQPIDRFVHDTGAAVSDQRSELVSTSEHSTDPFFLGFVGRHRARS